MLRPSRTIVTTVPIVLKIARRWSRLHMPAACNLGHLGHLDLITQTIGQSCHGSNGWVKGHELPTPGGMFVEAILGGDRVDSDLGPPDLLLSKAGGAGGREYIDGQSASVRQESA